MIISNPFQPGSYERIVSTCGGSPINAFTAIGLEISKRYFSQQSIMPPGDAYIKSLWESIWKTAHSENLPRPLASNEIGQPGTPEDSHLFGLTEKTMVDLPRHRADDTLRTLCFQIFATLLSPEFKACRLSYEESDSTGTCSRQSIEVCVDRVSGSHCEDCPFFVALSQEQHRKLLSRAFGADRQAAFLDHVTVYLPEDFRALRIFWHLHLRHIQTQP